MAGTRSRCSFRVLIEVELILLTTALEETEVLTEVDVGLLEALLEVEMILVLEDRLDAVVELLAILDVLGLVLLVGGLEVARVLLGKVPLLLLKSVLLLDNILLLDCVLPLLCDVLRLLDGVLLLDILF